MHAGVEHRGEKRAVADADLDAAAEERRTNEQSQGSKGMCGSGGTLSTSTPLQPGAGAGSGP
jgi:hypothetical protein